MNLDSIRDQFGSFWNSVTEGWRHLWESAANALTRFVPGTSTNLPQANEIDDDHFLPTRSWAMLGGDLFEDESRFIARVEIPGMEKDELNIEIRDDQLVISGEKRFERENTEGRWRVLQCAYGSFRRAIPLPCPVKDEEARASYKNGVLRIELPKRALSQPQDYRVKVE
jgi:HSP20 family protein